MDISKAQNKGNDWGSSSESNQIQNIVLVGRTGNGKSATGNSLIGQKVFKSKSYASGVTMECKKERVVKRGGQIINIIDTPGLFDLSVSAEFLSKEIIRCLALAEGGIHVILLVLSARTRITEEEEATLRTLQGLFGNKILDYAIVVFTGGDVLEDDGVTLAEYLGGCPHFLKEVLKLCNGRMVLFDNMTHDDDKKAEQVNKLLSLVDEIKMQKGGEPYTDDMYHKIKEETDRLRQQNEELESQGLSEEQAVDMKNQFMASHEERLSQMSKMVENTLKHTSKVQETPIREVRDGLQLPQEIPFMGMGGDQQSSQPMIQIRLPNCGTVGMECNIL